MLTLLDLNTPAFDEDCWARKGSVRYLRWPAELPDGTLLMIFVPATPLGVGVSSHEARETLNANRGAIQYAANEVYRRGDVEVFLTASDLGLPA